VRAGGGYPVIVRPRGVICQCKMRLASGGSHAPGDGTGGMTAPARQGV